MNPSLKMYCEARSSEFDMISEERKTLLLQLSKFVSEQTKKTELLFVCTHNSRRSTFGQVWAKAAATYFNFNNIETYSGGTEVTAFHPNAIYALKGAGFEVESENTKDNPKHVIGYVSGASDSLCYSKTFDDEANPKENFAAIMTCDSADSNCPFIPGAA